jgi:hypothetical protein
MLMLFMFVHVAFRWAFEQRNQEITTILMKTGVPHTDRDAQGLAPADLLTGKA